jgi:O-antigen ligase
MGIGLTVLVYFLAQGALRETFAARFAANSLEFYVFRRVHLWFSAWRAFSKSPLFGIGVGNFGFFDLNFGTGDGSEAHNLVLSTLAEEGLLAAIALFSALLLIVGKVVTVAKRRGGADLWIVAALLSSLINALIEPTFWAPAYAALFWITGVVFYRHAELELSQLARPDAVASRNRTDTAQGHRSSHGPAVLKPGLR